MARLWPRPQDRARHPRRGGRRAGLQGRRADDDHGRARRQGDIAGLKRLSPRRPAHFVARTRPSSALRHTREDRLHRPQLSQARGRDGNPVPKAPILFNKYNTALNCCGARSRPPRRRRRSSTTRRARHRHRPHGAQRRRGRCAGATSSATALATTSPRAICNRARASGCSASRSTARGDRPWLVTADQVDGDNLKIECR